jgi:exodeoxyribonuclease V alpha subunit
VKPAQALTLAAGTSTPAAALAEGLAEHLRRWAQALGAPPLAQAAVQGAGRALSEASRAGHVCLLLDDLAASMSISGLQTRAAWRDALLSSGVAAQAVPGQGVATAQPLVLDHEGRVYLHRAFDHERRLAECLQQGWASAGAPGTVAPTNMDPVQALAHHTPSGLSIVSGGPGTGKTTAIVQILATWLHASPTLRVALVAPTGKAAARMGEALKQRAEQLGSRLPAAVRERLPQEAQTVHRLLGTDPRTRRFMHDRQRPLAVDALVLDEASMLDLALARRLFDALPPAARVVCLGDADQLAAVEAGAVFAELCQALPPERHLALMHNHRFGRDSGIGQLAALLRAGREAALSEMLRALPDAAVMWHDDASQALDAGTRQSLMSGWIGYIMALQQPMPDPAAVLQALGRYRLLAAVQGGGRGVRALNQLSARHVLDSLPATANLPRVPEWYAGRPVMVLRNDPDLALFNGDIGVALPIGNNRDSFAVWFARSDGSLRSVAPARLPEHDTAFALTVHKSQGSEFDRVAVVLPAEPHPLLTRELVYTAVTRARSSVAVVAPLAVLQHACRTPTQRRSGLQARLAEAAGG